MFGRKTRERIRELELAVRVMGFEVCRMNGGHSWVSQDPAYPPAPGTDHGHMVCSNCLCPGVHRHYQDGELFLSGAGDQPDLTMLPE